MKKIFIIPILSLLFFVIKVEAIVEAPVDITTLGIVEVQSSLEKGYFTSEQLVQMYLDRIEMYDGMFSSINQINPNALSDAQKLDEERKNGNVRGILHGVPILVKANIDVVGIPTTAGTIALNDNYPYENAEVVKKLIDQGAIILGSTNMSELAFSAQVSYSSFGHVKNVFNTEYTPYGSSGGSAVAVTAGFAVASLGTDTNSSVRLPAAGAGLVGLRPTYGLLSSNGVIPYDVERDTVGILSKNVRDNAIILNAISENKVEEVEEVNFKELIIGVPTQFLYGSESSSGILGLTDTGISNLTVEAIKKMENAGAKIVYLDNFAQYKYYKYAYSTYAGITMCDNFNEYLKGTTGTIRTFKQLVKSDGHVQRLSGYAKGCNGTYKPKSYRDNLKNKYKEYVDSVYEEYDLDVIIYPTLKNRVYKINEGDNNSPGTIIASVIGYASINIPIGYLDDGFSYSVEFLIPPNQEDKLLDITYSFEKLNDNKNSMSSLTPSLYEIDESVSLLVELYEKEYANESYAGWVSEVREYFKNYNDIDDKKGEADKLIKIYEENDVEFKEDIVNNKYVYLILFVILVVGILFVTVVTMINNKIKKLKRKLKRKQYRAKKNKNKRKKKNKKRRK